MVARLKLKGEDGSYYGWWSMKFKLIIHVNLTYLICYFLAVLHGCRQLVLWDVRLNPS